MNKNIIIVAVVTVIMLFAGWFLYFKDTAPATEVTQSNPGTLPTGAKNIFQNTQGNSGSSSSEETKSVINDFLLQTPEANKYTLYKTTIVSNYALQEWGNGETGGQALLKNTPQKGWLLLSNGGGAWDVDGLTKFGLPRSVAQQLVSESTN